MAQGWCAGQIPHTGSVCGLDPAWNWSVDSASWVELQLWEQFTLQLLLGHPVAVLVGRPTDQMAWLCNPRLSITCKVGYLSLNAIPVIPFPSKVVSSPCLKLPFCWFPAQYPGKYFPTGLAGSCVQYPLIYIITIGI